MVKAAKGHGINPWTPGNGRVGELLGIEAPWLKRTG